MICWKFILWEYEARNKESDLEFGDQQELQQQSGLHVYKFSCFIFWEFCCLRSRLTILWRKLQHVLALTNYKQNCPIPGTYTPVPSKLQNEGILMASLTFLEEFPFSLFRLENNAYFGFLFLDLDSLSLKLGDHFGGERERAVFNFLAI